MNYTAQIIIKMANFPCTVISMTFTSQNCNVCPHLRGCMSIFRICGTLFPCVEDLVYLRIICGSVPVHTVCLIQVVNTV